MQSADDLEACVRAEYGSRLTGNTAVGKHILILGPPGSGKTTAIRAIVTANPDLCHVYDAALLSSARFLEYTDALFKRDDPSYFFPYEIEALAIRFLQNREAGAGALCDQGIHSIWAYARALHHAGRLDDLRYQSFFALFLTLRALSATPRCAVHFRSDAGVARERIVERARAHELVALTPNFLADLDSAYDAVVADLAAYTIVRRLDTTSLNADDTATKLQAILDAH